MAERRYRKKALVWIGWNALLRLAGAGIRVWSQNNKDATVWQMALAYSLVRVVTMVGLSAAVACLLQQEECGSLPMLIFLLRRAAVWSGAAAFCQIFLAGQLFPLPESTWDMLVLCGSALWLPITTLSAVWRGGVLSGRVEQKEILEAFYENTYKNESTEKI